MSPTLTLAPGGVDLLPAISLDELNASARLLTRVDRKYVLATDALADLWAALPADARVLEINGSRAFGYTSMYYDTESLDSYRDTAHRRRRRWKVRTRAYDTGATFLEVKTRQGAATVKERIEWAPSADHLGVDGHGFVADRLDNAGVTAPAPELSPSLETRYTRSTFYLPSSGARATLDSDLTWTDPVTGRISFLGEFVVLETKSAKSPSELDRALWAQGHRPAKISKYAVGMATLNPALPHNRWHRLLGRIDAA